MDVSEHLSHVLKQSSDSTSPRVRSLYSWRKTPSFYLAILSCALATILLGAVSGFLAGASSTPTVNTLLPLLLALIAGSGGFYFSSLNLETAQGQFGLLLTGLTIALFAGAFSGGLYFGIEARNGSPPKALRFPTHATPEDMVQLALLRRKLSIVGVDDVTAEVIISAYGDRIEKFGGRVPTVTVEELHSASGEIMKAVSTIPRGDLDEQDIEELEQMTDGLGFIRQTLEPWRANSDGMPYEIFASIVGSAYFYANSLSAEDWPFLNDWHLGNDDLSAATMKFYNTLHNFAGSEYVEIEYSPGDLDGFLADIISANPDTSDDVVVMPSIDTNVDK